MYIVCLPGPGLLSQHGDHAQGRQTPQRHDRPPTEKGTAAVGHKVTEVSGQLETLPPRSPESRLLLSYSLPPPLSLSRVRSLVLYMCWVGIVCLNQHILLLLPLL